MSMKTKILTENAEYFGKKLQEDLRSAAETDQDLLAIIETWLNGLGTAEHLTDSDNWIELSRRAERPIDDLQLLIGPVLLMARSCAEEHVTIEDLVDDLQEAGVLPCDDATATRKAALIRMGTPMLGMLRVEEAHTSPGLPLLYIDNIHTRCVFISEFDNEFGASTDEESYAPSLVRLHPRITLEVSFKDNDHKAIGILLTPRSLKRLKKWLTLAERQLSVSAKMVSRDIVSLQRE